MFRIIILFPLFFLSTNLQAGNFDNPEPSDKFIFYLHGSVEESEGETEKYEMAVDEISSGPAQVVSEVRGDTDPNTYSIGLKKQVNHLLSKGVPAKNITISGYSKGAIIALATAGLIKNPEISYVLLAGCSDDLNEKYEVAADKAVGRFLAIYDSEDDRYGSCSGVIKAENGTILEETELDSGKGHKVFRIPKEKFIEQWRDPLLDWIQ